MMRSPSSDANTCISDATHCSDTTICDRIVGNEKREKSEYNLDMMFHSIILISDQPYHFPAIEWCFDNDSDGINDMEKSDIGSTLDHARLLPLGIHSRDVGSRLESSKQNTPQIPRRTAQPNLAEIMQRLDQKKSAA
jgi:hypothetical protein